MAIKNILVSLRGTGSEGHVAFYGLALAQRLKAHVTAAASMEDMGAYIQTATALSGSGYADLQPVIEKQQSERYARARADFAEAMAMAKVPTVDKPTCHEATAYWLDSSRYTSPITSAGKLADLVIVDRPAEVDGFAVEDIETVLFGLRRATLLIPRGTKHLGKHAAVAWNGSTEAANAVRHAIELLEPGAKITIIQVGDLPDGATPASELADYLGWHCFESEIRIIDDQPKATARLILNAVRGAGSDLLIMGAYSHSRFRELFLGGVTSHMLHTCDVPVLMSH